MEPIQIIYPMLAQVVIICLVWVYMYYTRISRILDERIPPQALADRENARKHLEPVSGPSDNFMNLFEAPVIFFIAVLLIYITRQVDTVYVALAWIYVALRGVHSFIHCTYNNVTQRFVVYITSTLVLWVVWGRVIFHFFSKAVA